jgi:ribosomal protein L37E
MKIKIKEECRACGNNGADMRFDNTFGKLHLMCKRCGYKWEEKPLFLPETKEDNK